ncbi:hypothetical protein QQP08_014450 [Theobroma cacao]|nr:hypothetical protein QQP08_014450 [Theobroma cacao]
MSSNVVKINMEDRTILVSVVLKFTLNAESFDQLINERSFLNMVEHLQTLIFWREQLTTGSASGTLPPIQGVKLPAKYYTKIPVFSCSSNKAYLGCNLRKSSRTTVSEAVVPMVAPVSVAVGVTNAIDQWFPILALGCFLFSLINEASLDNMRNKSRGDPPFLPDSTSHVYDFRVIVPCRRFCSYVS